MSDAGRATVSVAGIGLVDSGPRSALGHGQLAGGTVGERAREGESTGLIDIQGAGPTDDVADIVGEGIATHVDESKRPATADADRAAALILPAVAVVPICRVPVLIVVAPV